MANSPASFFFLSESKRSEKVLSWQHKKRTQTAKNIIAQVVKNKYIVVLFFLFSDYSSNYQEYVMENRKKIIHNSSMVLCDARK